MKTTALLLLSMTLTAHALNLSSASIAAPQNLSPREQTALRMLIEEVEKRSRITLSTKSDPSAPSIKIQPRDQSLTVPESFKISVGANSVSVAANDDRGLFFAIGRLLRELRLSRDSITIPDDFQITTSPKYPLRGHQLGYRPKTHSYDAWDVKTWEQYYRDLIVFGCNAIELIPPRSDDDADSPHFPLPPMRMMIEMSKLADDYALDVWIWYPAMDKDYSSPATVEHALKEWSEVFSKLPRIDCVFVPGGDPGHTQPKYLMALLEKQTASLHKYHPKAQMWVSPQGFTQPWMDEFLQILNNEQPAWLSGLVYGPQVRIPLPKLRSLAPKKYPIRDYPDITHTRQCQFPVPDWDVAYAITENRECINPRPIDYTTIARANLPFSTGFITYSEGCNDDVNKAIWSALGWDPNTQPEETLRQYSRYFIGAEYETNFTEGLLALEKNWRGPLATNTAVDATLAHFQKMEKAASPQTMRNWRFQQALLRAYMDAYVRHRLIQETKVEELALKELRVVSTPASDRIKKAEAILDLNVLPKFEISNLKSEIISIPALRARINELGEMLFQSIQMQLTVDRHKAIGPDRGASLTTLDAPLNNRAWLKHQIKLAKENDAESIVEKILNWTNPGEGGFYDDLGNPAKQPHLLQGLTFAEDPSRMYSTRVDFEEDLVFDSTDETAGLPRRLSWMDHAESLYDTPLRMQYLDLDKSTKYKLRVLYGGDNRRKIRLVANNTTEIHPHIERSLPYKVLEFEIPKELTASGQLQLRFEPEPGLGGNGRNTQVSEVWLIRN